ncbi:MAG TPA: histidine kinase [Ignavibacteriales bacterium]|nr:histidine kinase [Ignavibacteriales bacterium]
MKKYFLIIWFVLIAQTGLLAQAKISFKVITGTLTGNQNIFIAGSNQELGNWNADKVKLDKINDTTWSKTFYFEIGETIEFKFTLGSWENEALNENDKIPANSVVKILKDTSIVFRVLKWGSSKTKISGKVTGNVRYHKNFKGRNLLSRDIIVWLPPDYDSSAERYYPVLYLQDGQNIFDPATSAFGIDWQMDETADSLIKSKSIQSIIIVGIYNTQNRSMEYDNTELGHTYLKFIIEELKPFIDRNYNTLPDKQNTAIAGSSSGGLISFIMTWENPDVFSKAACLSTPFKISNIDYVAPVKTYSGARKNIKLYIDNGGIGLEQQLQPGIDEIIAALKHKGYIENKDFLWINEQAAEHNESAWAKRVYKFLEFLFPVQE